jgi:hypothetical protein
VSRAARYDAGGEDNRKGLLALAGHREDVVPINFSSDGRHVATEARMAELGVVVATVRELRRYGGKQGESHPWGFSCMEEPFSAPKTPARYVFGCGFRPELRRFEVELPSKMTKT